MKVSAAGGWYLGLWLLGLTLLLAGVNGVACQRSRPVVHSLAFGKGGGGCQQLCAPLLSCYRFRRCCSAASSTAEFRLGSQHAVGGVRAHARGSLASGTPEVDDKLSESKTRELGPNCKRLYELCTGPAPPVGRQPCCILRPQSARSLPARCSQLSRASAAGVCGAAPCPPRQLETAGVLSAACLLRAARQKAPSPRSLRRFKSRAQRSVPADLLRIPACAQKHVKTFS